MRVSRWTKERGDEKDFWASGSPLHMAVKGILAALPPKKTPTSEPDDLPLSLKRGRAGPGSGHEGGGWRGAAGWMRQGWVKFKASLGRTEKGGSLLIATAATAASLGLPEERHPCRRDWGCPSWPRPAFCPERGCFPPQGSSLGFPEAKTAPRGGRRGARFPSASLLSEQSPSGRGTEERDLWPLGRAARAPWAREGIWADGAGSEAGPPYGFSAAGRPARQAGILSAAFPTDVSKGQAAYANDFNKYFFYVILLPNIN